MIRTTLKSTLFNTVKSFFSTSPKQQFAKTFLVKIQYTNQSDAYYQTYPYRQQFRKQIKALEDSNKCYLIGGDQFPLQSTQLAINCDQKQLIQDFLQKNVYKKHNLVKTYTIQEVQKISEQKIKKLAYFYEYQ